MANFSNCLISFIEHFSCKIRINCCVVCVSKPTRFCTSSFLLMRNKAPFVLMVESFRPARMYSRKNRLSLDWFFLTCAPNLDWDFPQGGACGYSDNKKSLNRLDPVLFLCRNRLCGVLLFLLGIGRSAVEAGGVRDLKLRRAYEINLRGLLFETQAISRSCSVFCLYTLYSLYRTIHLIHYRTLAKHLKIKRKNKDDFN